MSPPTLVDEPGHTRTYESYIHARRLNCYRQRYKGETGGWVGLHLEGCQKFCFAFS